MIYVHNPLPYLPNGLLRVSTHPTSFEDDIHEQKNFKERSISQQPDLLPRLSTKFLENLNLYGVDGEGGELLHSKTLIVHSSGDLISSTLQTTYMSYSEIFSVAWSNILIYEDIMRLDQTHESLQSDAVPVRCICSLDKFSMNFFSVWGERFSSTVQFKVSSIWSTEYGILIENLESPLSRRSSQSSQKDSIGAEDPQHVMLYSIAHPLDDPSPVFIKQGIHLQTWRPTTRIVHTSDVDAPLVLTYDERTKLHSVFILRRMSRGEHRSSQSSLDNSSFLNNFNASSSNPITNLGSEWKNSFRKKLRSKLGFSTNSTRTRQTLLPNIATAHLASSSPFLSRSQSPMAAISRCHSPNNLSSSSSHQRQTYYNDKLNQTPSTINHTAFRGDSTNANKYSDIFLNCSWFKMPETTLCMEHIWSESMIPSKDSQRRHASKAFLSRDLNGRAYLCYFIQNEFKLYINELKQSDSVHPRTLEGCVRISARDVINIDALKMILILELDWNITVYSGPTILGKLHIPRTIPNPLSTSVSLTRTYYQTALMTCGVMTHSSTLNQPLMPDLKENGSHLLCPSAKSSASATSVNVRWPNDTSTDFISSTIDGFIMSDGVMNQSKITIPDARMTPLVTMCLQTLRSVLPHDLTMQLMIKWFLIRNAPGPEDLTIDQEWESFLIIILTLFGYDVNKIHSRDGDDVDITLQHCGVRTLHKKAKVLKKGSSDDWINLTNLELTTKISTFLSKNLCLNTEQSTQTAQTVSQVVSKALNISKIDFQSGFANYLPQTVFSLHLLYEDIKLSCDMNESVPLLAKLLHLLCIDLDLRRYECHYQRDFPVLEFATRVDRRDGRKLIIPEYLLSGVPDILGSLYSLLVSSQLRPYPHITGVNSLSKDLIKIFSGSKFRDDTILARMDHILQVPVITNKTRSTWLTGISDDRSQRIIEYCWKKGICQRRLSLLPPSINLMLNHVIHRCKGNPPPSWSSPIHELIQREDLVLLKNDSERDYYMDIEIFDYPQHGDLLGIHKLGDGMEFDFTILQLRFNKDHRVSEVRRLLNSSEPVMITVSQKTDVSDHEFIEEQEKSLYATCIRTMSLPIGRGMFTLRTSQPINTEQLSIPTLCLSGRAPPRGTTVELTHIDVPNNLSLWPSFHNGVAAGLRVHPDAHDVDSTWIVFNRQPQSGFSIDHSGFLMALGLNGHLKNLAPFSLYEYLVECHETTSVGLLLGLSASHRSSMDISMRKLLSLHVETLLPPTSIELNVHQNVQVAALIGIGLVYLRTSHSHIAHALLTEIGRPPGPEMKNCIDRESYSLAAGLALGLVILESGGGPDLDDIPDTLHYYIMGGSVRPFSGTQKDKYRSPSYQIREGHTINADVTSPGATLALGMMYLKSGNSAVAEWMTVPDTQYLLDFVQPDFLLLRILAKSLILWDDIEPSRTWVSSHVPQMIARNKLRRPIDDELKPTDLETINQAYCNIIAGSCMAIGLKYAGTGDITAFRTVHHFLKMFISLLGRSVAELTGRATLENCLNVILLADAVIMSGTGNLEILRICRFLRTRVGPSFSTVTYGSHVATHMALGLLFLGGGRYTLSNDAASISMLMIALFPKFPTHSNDNRYHMQALRHLYVLATEPRLLLPMDIHNEKFCYVSMKLSLTPSPHKSSEMIVRAPCIMPQLEKLEKVELNDDRYWRIVFKKEENFGDLRNILEGDCILHVKRKAGCLSYVKDPQGSRTLLAQTLTADRFIVWNAGVEQVTSFTTDPVVRIFERKFIDSSASQQQLTHSHGYELGCTRFELLYCPLERDTIDDAQIPLNHVMNVPSGSSDMEKRSHEYLTSSTYECVVRDRMMSLAPWFSYFHALTTLKIHLDSLLIEEINSLHPFVLVSDYFIEPGYPPNTENFLAIEQEVLSVIDSTDEQIRLPESDSDRVSTRDSNMWKT